LPFYSCVNDGRTRQDLGQEKKVEILYT